MRKILTLLLTLLIGFGASAQLSPGDIAFVQYNADGPEIIKFIAFTDIPAGEVIYFTDNGWLASGSLRSGEGTFAWASAGVSCGDIVTIDLTGPALSGSGDQLIAYQGPAVGTVTTVITALNSEGAGVWQADATNANTSALPTGLTNGLNAIALNEIDNAMYTGPTLSGTIATMRAAIHDNTNWSGDNTIEQDFTATIALTDCSGPAGPAISVGSTSMSGFTYVQGTGPSASSVNSLEWENLTGSVTSGNTVNFFEFSIDGGTSWNNATILNVPIPPFPGTSASPVNVLVRLQAGLSAGNYLDTVVLASAGASTVEVYLSGTVTLPTPDIIINEFQADPDGTLGDANGDGTVNGSEDEFVEFYNNEASPVDMTNWTIEDGFGPRHTFPAGSVVPAGGFITVFGGGAPTGISGIVQTASGGLLGLNNGGDDIILKDALGTIVVQYTYGSEGGNNEALGRDPDFTGAFVSHPLIVATGRLFSPGELNVTPPSSCSIAIDNAVPSACNPVSNTYSVDVTVSWSSAPATGTLDINGTSFAFTSSPQTFTLTGLAPSGAAEDVTAVFSDDGTCTATSIGAYTSPAPCLAPIAPCTELFFSEYIEGSGNNKCIEIYNPTANDIDMAAGGYAISRFNNGSTSDDGPWALSGIVPAYGTYVICNSSADAALQARADSVGGFFNSITFYNGDDVVALTKGAAFIDVIGQLGVDPGSAWSNGGVSTANQTLVRMASVQAGDNVESDLFDPSVEWMSFPTDDATNLGFHNSTCAPFVWTGLASTDYHTGLNWTKGTVPTNADHAWIPSAPVGGVFPIASANASLADLTVRTGASFNMAPTFGLIFSGTANVDGILTLESDATGTAWLDDFSSFTATYNGDITVQTYVTTGSGLGQRYFGSPVVSGTVSGLDGTYASGYPLGPVEPLPTCDPTTLATGSPYSNLFQWNENDPFTLGCVQEGWEAISASTPLTPGRGYSGWMNDGSIISVTGAPNTGNVNYATSGATPPFVAGATGWHVLSNPYPSPINAAVATTGGWSSVQVYNGASGPFSGTFFPSILLGGIAVMQGFVAEATGAPVFSASNSFRMTGNEVWQRPDLGHLLNITVLGNGVGDQSFVYFKHDATDNFDIEGDCKKFQSDAGYPTMFTMNNGERMSLNGLSSDNMNRSIDLGLMPGVTGSFTMSFDGLSSFPATTLIFLEDKLTGEMVNVREVNEYTFDADVNDNEDRFVLHFTSPIEVATIDASCEGGDASIAVDFGQSQVAGNAISWNYELIKNGSTVSSSVYQNGLVTLNNLEKGTYTLELQQGNYNTSMDVVVDGAEQVVADFENPLAVEEGTWVNLANLSSGALNYEWTVEGQQYATQDLNHQFITPGQHEITLMSSNDDCQEVKSKFIEVLAKTTGITDAPELANANVYTKDNLIVIDLNGVENIEDYTAFVFNLLGQEVEVVEISSAITQVEVNDGGKYYFVQLVQGKTQKVFKVLVK